jgi:c(7)-type cytochrome triheme protein
MSCSIRRRIRRVSPCLVLVSLAVTAAAIFPASAATTGTSTSPPVALKLPADLVYDRGLRADSVVTFSHATHVEFAGNTCTGCHPKPFHMLHPTHRTSHAVMNAGGACGTCHDGKQAFGTREPASCGTCHAGRASRTMAVRDSSGTPVAAPRKGPGPHAYAASADSPGRVTFRHETHLKRGESCATCHPKPFAMHFSPPRPAGGMHEAAACGRCHDGKQAFATDDGERCTRCHVEGGR